MGSDRVAGVVLAAGTSERMGETKQLLRFRNAPLVQAVIDVAEASTLDEVVVVTGADGDRVEDAIWLTRSRLVRNRDFEKGNMSSLESGAAAVPDADALVLLNADQPEVTVAVVDGMVGLWRSEKPWAAVARYDDRMAHPYLLSSDCLADAVVMGGSKVLWRLVARDVSGKALQYRIPGPAPLDVNTPADFDRLSDHSGR